MELIFYNEAAQILGISVDTLQQALKRDVLTKAGRKGRYMCLIKEQVMLFTGVNPRTGNKKRLSLEALTPQERKKWEEYAMQGAGQVATSVTMPKEDIKAIVQAEVSEQAEQLQDAFAEFLLVLGLTFKDTVVPSVKELTKLNKAESGVPQGIPFLRILREIKHAV